MTGTSLNAERRRRDLDWLHGRRTVDLLVVGGGVTGAGIALDAASRGLSVVLAEKHDLAFGTSRWSSKLIHGGLRYLASGHVGIAYQSAVERGILMTRVAPHLTHPLPVLGAVLPGATAAQRVTTRGAFRAGDLLRIAAGTSGQLLPRSRMISRAETLRLAPTLRVDGLRGGLLGWDGQLVDDARLVVAIARTAAGHGARILTRCAAEQVTGSGAVLVDRLTGDRIDLHARAVINATGVWAGEVAPGIRLRPSRGTHLVFAAETFGGLSADLIVPVPGERTRVAMAIPAPDGRVYVGITDEDAPGPIPDVPEPTEGEIDFLLETVSSVLRAPLSREDLIGTYAGLRPLLQADGRTADLSRRHAVVTAPDGLVSVIGGKLTTYRRVAEDALDAAIRRAGLDAEPCRTDRLPLVGAADRVSLAGVRAPDRLVRRYGTEAPGLLDAPEPVAPGLATTRAELRFAVQHEGALDEDDLLDRRTRIGLSAVDRAAALPAAREALAATTVG